MAPTTFEKSIICLLEDPSERTQYKLQEQFKKIGAPAVELLEDLIQRKNTELASAARLHLKRLHGKDAADDFTQFIHSFNYELETGYLLLEQSLYPGIKVEAILSYLDQLAQRCKDLFINPCSAKEKCQVINRVLFHEKSIRPLSNIETPQNTFLSQVIEDKRGNEISLALLYTLVAQRCNLDLNPIITPGSMMIGCFLDDEPFYVSPLESGTIRDIDEIREHHQKQDMYFDDDFFFPCSVGSVLRCVCETLAKQYIDRQQHHLAQLFISFVDDFDSAYQNNT